MTSWPRRGCVFVFLLLAGCGARGPGVPVNGTVTFNGEPLVQGSVSFLDETGVTAAMGIVEKGRYDMQMSQSFAGVKPGHYDVIVLSWIERPGSERADGSISKGVSRIPMKYTAAQTSGFSVDVGPNGETVDFQLEGQP